MRRHLTLGIVILTAHLSVADDLKSKGSLIAEGTAKHMREQIAAEIKTLPSGSWAGEYFAFGGLGVDISLSMAPKAGFVFEWHGCLGLYDRNYGMVTWTNDHIRLCFTFENELKSFQGIAQDLFPIRWGDRHYLVPADNVIGFCNRVNDGAEARYPTGGLFLLRRGDEKIPVSGTPKVPRKFAAYLLSKPIIGEIISVGMPVTRPSIAKWKFTDTSVVLNVGGNDGLRKGMSLHVCAPTNVFESVEITKVESNRSEAVMTQIGEDEPGPKAGWRVSTRAPWAGSTQELR